MERRNFIIKSSIAAGLIFTPELYAKNYTHRDTDSLFINQCKDPIHIRSIDILQIKNDLLIQVISKDGHIGRIPANSRIKYLLGMLKDLIIPHFIGEDAKNIETVTSKVYRINSNYKYAGMPFWICFAHVELAILDMLAKIENLPVGRLFSEPLRNEFPVYLSTFDRENHAEVYAGNVQKRIGNFKAVKIKIGGRMSNNRDCIEGRTEKLIPLLRESLGEEITLYVDANSSYDTPKAIEVGRLLEEFNYGFFEEPCPWQDYEATLKAAHALDIPIAGGEQDSSSAQFEYMIKKNVVDVIQPDIMYNGGFIRALKIAQFAKQNKKPVTLHSPQQGAANAFKMQFASIVENIGPFQEYNTGKGYDWCSVDLDFREGKLQIVNKPGWGIEYDTDALQKAIKI